MRILCEATARRSIAEGWKRVFDVSGHECTIWSSADKSAFDVFDEIDPHLFIMASDDRELRSPGSCLRQPGPSGQPDLRSDRRGMHKCIKERRHMKVVSFADPMPAGDTFLYYPEPSNPNLLCDFTYIGAYRPDKEAFLNAYLLPLAAEGSLKIFGSGPWPTSDYLGSVSNSTAREAYNSAELCIDISTNRRISDRPYNVALCLGCVVSNLPCWELDFHKLVHYPNQKSFIKAVLELSVRNSKMERVRKDIAFQNYQLTLKNHTYWHRCHDILVAAGCQREAAGLMEQYSATVRV